MILGWRTMPSIPRTDKTLSIRLQEDRCNEVSHKLLREVDEDSQCRKFKDPFPQGSLTKLEEDAVSNPPCSEQGIKWDSNHSLNEVVRLDQDNLSFEEDTLKE